jgi:shikimate dehydrogenase
MIASTPLLIASCPGRTVPALKTELQQAVRGGADLGEVRLDRLVPGDRARLGELFPAPLPLVATLRSRAEGGEGPDSSAERIALLESAEQFPFQILDIEPARDGALLRDGEPKRRHAETLILSSHLPESTPTRDVRRLLEMPRPPGTVAKVVLPCGFDRLWSDLLPGLSPLEAYAPYILHTTGPTGPILRAWACRLGMFAVYASLPTSTSGEPIESVEPSQIPVDRLRSYVSAGSEGSLFGVVGHPIGHTRSPAIHALWMQEERRNGLYLALDMATAQEVAESLGPLAVGGFRGLNVTHPWKQVALSLSSQALPAAEAAACANTLSFAPGTITAENTDVAAVRRRLSELKEEGVWDESPIVVLGGGGAARSALAAASSLGSSGVVITRRPEVAEALARDFGGEVGVGPSLKPARVVIHATPAGREETPRLDLPWANVVDASTHLLDFVYAPVHPFLREGARARGATYEDGSRLLVYQAAESYATWWGTPPSSELQAAALKEVMCGG